LQLFSEHPYRESMPERSILTLYVAGRQSNKHHIWGFGRRSAKIQNKYLNGSFREHMNPTGTPQTVRNLSEEPAGHSPLRRPR
jgi:hypothetical protein